MHAIQTETGKEYQKFAEFVTYVVYIFAKNSDQRDVLEWLYYIINGICADGEQAKAFWFSEGRTKV